MEKPQIGFSSALTSVVLFFSQVLKSRSIFIYKVMNMEERPSQVIEEYLLVLYKLQRDGEKAKSVTLANSLDTSAPTVHATVGRMQRDGLIKVNRSKEIQLTQLGFEMAENIAYRHNLAEDFLWNTLGIPWFEVHKHAHQLEHAMTPYSY